MTPRDLQIQIEAAAEIGFVVREGHDVRAAFTTARELANWIEARLAALDVPEPAFDHLPQVLQSAADSSPPPRGLRLFRGAR